MPTQSKDAEQSFVDAIAERVVDRLKTEISRPIIQFGDMGVEPLRVYNVKEAARLLGSHVSSVYQIPEEELPRHRRAGSGIGFLGANLLMYQNGLPPLDVETALEEFRQSFLRDRPAKPTSRSDKLNSTRII